MALGRRRRAVAAATSRGYALHSRRDSSRPGKEASACALYGFCEQRRAARDARERCPRAGAASSSSSANRSAGVLARVGRDPARRGLVVLSDGSDNSGLVQPRADGGDPQAATCPVHTVGLGPRRDQRRHRAPGRRHYAPSTALPKSRVSAQVTIRHPGRRSRYRPAHGEGRRRRCWPPKDVALAPRRERAGRMAWTFSAGDPGLRDLSFTRRRACRARTITGNNTLQPRDGRAARSSQARALRGRRAALGIQVHPPRAPPGRPERATGRPCCAPPPTSTTAKASTRPTDLKRGLPRDRRGRALPPTTG